jgi:membrane protein EpsK
VIGRLRRALTADRDYTGALASGYAQMAVNAAVQLLMVPLYLATIGRDGFGILMVLLALATYVAIGALWLTGGVTRNLGERAAEEDHAGFASVWAGGKWASVIYAGGVGAIGLAILTSFPAMLGDRVGAVPNLWLALILFVLNLMVAWSLAVDRVGLNVTRRQTASNGLAIMAQLVFVACAVPLLLYTDAGLAAVTGALLIGNVAAELTARLMWRRYGYQLSWFADPAAARRRVADMLSRRGGGFTLFGILQLTLQADLLIIGIIGGPLLAADFALVWKIAEVVGVALGRIPDALQPRMIQHDVRGEHGELARAMRRIDRTMLLLAGGFALVYAFAGQWIVTLWVGADNVPDSPWGYALAGGAVFWLALAKLPTAAAFVTVRLRPLVTIMAGELAGKLALMAALVGPLGFIAPLAAINIVHIGGAAWAYRWLLRRVATGAGKPPAPPQSGEEAATH